MRSPDVDPLVADATVAIMTARALRRDLSHDLGAALARVTDAERTVRRQIAVAARRH